MRFKKRASDKLLGMLLEYVPKKRISEEIAQEWLDNPGALGRLLEPLCRAPETLSVLTMNFCKPLSEGQRADLLKCFLRERLPEPFAAEAVEKLTELLDEPPVRGGDEADTTRINLQRVEVLVGFLSDCLKPKYAAEAIKKLYDLLGLTEMVESAGKSAKGESLPV